MGPLFSWVYLLCPLRTLSTALCFYRMPLTSPADPLLRNEMKLYETKKMPPSRLTALSSSVQLQIFKSKSLNLIYYIRTVVPKFYNQGKVPVLMELSSINRAGSLTFSSLVPELGRKKKTKQRKKN